MNDRLSSAMNRLAAECADVQPPPEVQAAVLVEFDVEFDRKRQRKRRSKGMLAAGTVAACLVAVLVLEYRPLLRRSPHTVYVSGEVRRSFPSDYRPAEEPFVPIPYIAPPAPYERVEVVRMELPVAALIAAGLTVRTADPGARVEAEVLVGQDGRARAVRLISNSN
jgi:hypothetical protein